MTDQTSESQESRNVQIAGAVTATEKEAIQRVKQETQRDVSNLLREYTVQELIDWGRRLLAEDTTALEVA